MAGELLLVPSAAPRRGKMSTAHNGFFFRTTVFASPWISASTPLPCQNLIGAKLFPPEMYRSLHILLVHPTSRRASIRLETPNKNPSFSLVDLNFEEGPLTVSILQLILQKSRFAHSLCLAKISSYRGQGFGYILLGSITLLRYTPTRLLGSLNQSFRSLVYALYVLFFLKSLGVSLLNSYCQQPDCGYDSLLAINHPVSILASDPNHHLKINNSISCSIPPPLKTNTHQMPGTLNHSLSVSFRLQALCESLNLHSQGSYERETPPALLRFDTYLWHIRLIASLESFFAPKHIEFHVMALVLPQEASIAPASCLAMTTLSTSPSHSLTGTIPSTTELSVEDLSKNHYLSCDICFLASASKLFWIICRCLLSLFVWHWGLPFFCFCFRTWILVSFSLYLVL